MGGFFLSCHGEAPVADPLGAPLAAMERLGFSGHRRLDGGDYRLAVLPKLHHNDCNLVEFPGGDFVFACGLMIYDGALGAPALQAFYRDFRFEPSIARRAFGMFALVVRKDGRTCILGDALGAFAIFVDAEGQRCATSFLALAESSERLSLSAQGVYEYVFNGVVSGNATLVDDIRILPQGAMAVVEAGRLRILRQAPAIEEPYREPPARLVDATVERLDHYMGTIAGLFGDRVSCALSGGYDSRLLLGLAQRHGVAPQIFVYGRDGDADVRMARSIADAEGIRLLHVDKDTEPLPPAERFAAAVERNFLESDGLEWGGVFSTNAESAERRRRTAEGRIYFHGGGGETLRNFFYLPDIRLSPRQLVKSFWAGCDPDACTDAFRLGAYVEGLEAKMLDLLGARPRRLERHWMEWLYPNMRCRSWDGRVHSNNLRFGYSAAPFLDVPVAQHGYRIPVPYKYHGRFEAAVIRRLAPRLAAYPSAYGFAFDRDPPLGRVLSDWLTYVRPPALRAAAYRIRHRMMRQDPWSGPLARDHVAAVLPDGLPWMSRLFRLERLRDPDRLGRALSVEYLARRLGGRLRQAIAA